MITIKNVKNMAGAVETQTIESDEERTIDAEGKLTILPAMIDPHVHFRTPGHEHKENWISGAKACVAGGICTVFDMPNNEPPCSSVENLKKKKELIDSQLKEAGIPLRYYLYFGADKNNYQEIGKVQHDIVGVKIYMGSSTGGLLMDDEEGLDHVFRVCAQDNLMVTVHAEDESILQAFQEKHAGASDPAAHSLIRDRSAAAKAVEMAINLAEKYNSQLCIAHVSTKEEVDLIRKAKDSGLLIYGEATPHHLFLTEEDYKKWGTLVQMNPPLRTMEDQEALWEGIHAGTIEFIGSDHAPHTLEEKKQPYGKAPSGVPGLETTLPLLLNAYHEGRLTLKKIIELTRKNIEAIFNLPHHNDAVLVDLEMEREVKDELLRTKCGWSPFTGRKLKGWPVYTIIQGRVFDA